jgi:hypothetical protein
MASRYYADQTSFQLAEPAPVQNQWSLFSIGIPFCCRDTGFRNLATEIVTSLHRRYAFDQGVKHTLKSSLTSGHDREWKEKHNKTTSPDGEINLSMLENALLHHFYISISYD